MRDPAENVYCVACQATLTKHTVEHHHFPIPESAGGTETVPLCKVCHDHVDRLPLARWPEGWAWNAVIQAHTSTNRETRLLLMKLCSLTAYNEAVKVGIATKGYPAAIKSGWAEERAVAEFNDVPAPRRAKSPRRELAEAKP